MKLLDYLLSIYITVKGWVLADGYEQTDDLSVNYLTNVPGLIYPSYRRIGGQLQTTVGTSGYFNGTNAYSTVPSYSALNTLNGTFEFWAIPDDISKAGTMIYRSGQVLIRQSWGDIYFRMGSASWDISINKVMANGGKYHIAVVCSDTGTGVDVTPYINGKKYATQNVYGAHLPTSNTNILNVGYNGSADFYKGKLDEIIFYNTALTEAQIIERYNKGNGSQAVPTGINESTQVTLYFSDSATNVATLGAGNNMTLSNVTLTDGIITSTGYGSSGVWAMSFSNTEMNEIPFQAQLPHGWREGDPISFHLHYGILNDMGDSKAARFNIEYTIASVDEAWNYTTVVGDDLDCSSGKVNKHNVKAIATIPMDGKKISTVINGRIFREPTHANDNYDAEVFVGYSDFHIKVNTAGSTQEWVK